MDILWEKDAYALVPTDLGLVQKLQWSTELPAGWTNDEAYRTHEETLQTLLSFHLAEVCGEPVQLVGSAGDHWGGADIIGLDTLGRIHLFELKRGTIGIRAARQLSYYLLRYVFVEPAWFIEYWWKRMGKWELQDWRLAETIAGALAGQRTSTIGWSFVREYGEAVQVSEREWENWEDRKKHPLRLAALLAKARVFHNEVPTAEAVLKTARAWRSRLRPSAEPPSGKFICERPVVIWLVGANFTTDAKREIRRWRSAGIDARCLQAEVRHSSQGNGLIFRVAREVAPGRAELVRQLEQWAANNPALSTSSRLKLHLYTEAPPSSSVKEKETMGFPKDRPKAEIEPPTGDVIKLLAPEA